MDTTIQVHQISSEWFKDIVKQPVETCVCVFPISKSHPWQVVRKLGCHPWRCSVVCFHFYLQHSEVSVWLLAACHSRICFAGYFNNLQHIKGSQRFVPHLCRCRRLLHADRASRGAEPSEGDGSARWRSNSSVPTQSNSWMNVTTLSGGQWKLWFQSCNLEQYARTPQQIAINKSLVQAMFLWLSWTCVPSASDILLQ